jgi:hypothetical protein
MNLAIITNGVYKEGHSTDLLLVKMTEDWRRALDNNLVVGVVFVDPTKAFDSPRSTKKASRTRYIW